MARFIGTALGAGDGAIVILTPPHRQMLEALLAANGLDVERVRISGRYVVLDARQTLGKFLVDGMPDPARLAYTIGNVVAGVRSAMQVPTNAIAAFGEMVALLWKKGNGAAAIRLEQLWTSLTGELRLSLHCAYSINDFYLPEHTESLRQICAEHSHGTVNESYLALAGEDERLHQVVRLQHPEQLCEELLRANQQLERQLASHNQSEQRLRLSEESLRGLSAALLRTQDQERRRLGRELQDAVGQHLTAVKMNLHLLKCDVQDNVPASVAQIDQCAELMDLAIRHVRQTSYTLYPPMLDELGLRTAVEWYLQDFSERTRIQVSLQISQEIGRLPAEVEVCAFRVIQECLNNVQIHSRSCIAQVRIDFSGGELRLEIRDHGAGIDDFTLKCAREFVGTLGIGLRSVHHRLRQLRGSWDLASDANGTVVRALIPIEAVAARQAAGSSLK